MSTYDGDDLSLYPASEPPHTRGGTLHIPLRMPGDPAPAGPQSLTKDQHYHLLNRQVPDLKLKLSVSAGRVAELEAEAGVSAARISGLEAGAEAAAARIAELTSE